MFRLTRTELLTGFNTMMGADMGLQPTRFFNGWLLAWACCCLIASGTAFFFLVTMHANIFMELQALLKRAESYG